MCDTMVCMPSTTLSKNMIFAKNSDRSPNEPHIIERIPALDHDLVNEPKVMTTYIKVDQVRHTYAVTLMKPSWIWGAEMGFNEHGVNIGNEAVFTKVRRGGDALLGMDLLRLALERNETAYDAMLCITDLLSEYGQGGNCGYQKKFYYDNSYLIADGREAYVLETAGKYWAAKKVQDIYSISNGLTIEGDYDYAHPEVMAERDSNPGYSFKKKFSEPIFTFFSRSRKRRYCATSQLKEESGYITAGTLMKVLRSHAIDIEGKPSVGSVCMHAGGLIGDHTTGGYVAELGSTPIYYVTGASLPCLSMFKPLLTEYVEGDCSNLGIKYWLKRELLNRYFLAKQADSVSFMEKVYELEVDMLDRVEKIKDEQSLKAMITEITLKEDTLVNEYLTALKGAEHNFTLGNRQYRSFWQNKTKKLLNDLKEHLE